MFKEDALHQNEAISPGRYETGSKDTIQKRWEPWGDSKGKSFPHSCTGRTVCEAKMRFMAPLIPLNILKDLRF